MHYYVMIAKIMKQLANFYDNTKLKKTRKKQKRHKLPIYQVNYTNEKGLRERPK